MPTDIDALIADVLAKYAAWQKAGIGGYKGVEYRVAAADAAPVLALDLKRCREACKAVVEFGAHHPECKCIVRGQCDCGYVQCKTALTPEANTNDQR